MIPIYTYGETPEEELFARPDQGRDVTKIVADIIAAVRREGDRAVRDYTARFDRADLADFAVTPAELEQALASISPEFRAVLEQAAQNIRSFHARQARQGFVAADRPGVVLGQKVTPIENVGIYVPGGSAPLPSTVLMDAIPAKIAGCRRIVMVSPPGPDGTLNSAILAAASIAGVDEIYKIGGAQAVAALAYGTESIRPVDKIVGPGNAFVAEAKRQVFGQVGIDMIAGPSDILVLADGKNDPAHVAADLLGQAEHDPLATAILVTDSAALAQAVAAELERQLPLLPRKEIAGASIQNRGKIILAPDLGVGVDIANRIAPEHLELMVDEPFAYLPAIRNAGSIFLGRSCPEVLGDYFAGPNHTLPTAGTARFSSPLSVDDFVKKSQFLCYTPAALADVADQVARFARAEGLNAHERSVTIRQEGKV